MKIERRALLLAAAAGLATAPEVRLGILQFGTVQWVAEIIRRHALDAQFGITLRPVLLANTDAGRVSLMAGAADVILSDWPFVASRRAVGTMLAFAPFSSASGGILAAAGASIAGLAGLRGRKLGVAGGPADKSWLIVQAAGRAQGIDLAAAASVVYGAPPLLGAKLQQGELDAVLTFWNFAARLEAAGFREVVSVAACAQSLGISPLISMTGFVFHEAWARANRPAIDGFLRAVAAADRLLAGSDTEWQALRPLMEAKDDALAARLRDRFRAGLAIAGVADQAQAAARLFAVLRQTGGPHATDGIDSLPPGVFWPIPDEASR